MRFAPLDRHFTGVAVPVAALRSGDCCGVGEFADLTLLGRWCVDAGLDLIQLLPVNDTGGNSSPYSAVSAFALLPLHVRLQALPGAERYAEEIRLFREEAAAFEQAAHGRFSYPRTLAFKLSVLGRLFADNERLMDTDSAFAAWREQNPWVVPYSVFTVLRGENGALQWSSWPALSNPTPGQVKEWWKRRGGRKSCRWEPGAQRFCRFHRRPRTPRLVSGAGRAEGGCRTAGARRRLAPP